MNIRHIKFLRNKSLFGKFIRLPIKLIPGSAILKILSGHLKGKKWIKGAHNISVLLGTYERKQSTEFLSYCKDAKSFWDLGAHTGYYTLLYYFANPAGKIFAFEPNEVNLSLFRKHMALNNIHDYSLFDVAVSDKEGMLSFKKSATTVAGKLDDAGEIKVKVVRLSRLLSEEKVDMPDLIKMDIEGAEINVLKDLQSVLTRKKPVLFVSTHGQEVHKSCVALLKEMNYRLKPLDKSDLDASREVLAY